MVRAAGSYDRQVLNWLCCSHTQTQTVASTFRVVNCHPPPMHLNCLSFIEALMEHTVATLPSAVLAVHKFGNGTTGHDSCIQQANKYYVPYTCFGEASSGAQSW